MKTSRPATALFVSASTCDLNSNRSFVLILLWWKFLFLEERTLAAFASKKAAEADMIIVSANAGNEFPWAVEHWMESWVSRRTVWPSVLVPLIGSANDQADAVTPRHLYLTKVGQQ